MKNQKILVTGANGFVGASVCADLVFKGYPVVAAIRDSASGYRVAQDGLVEVIKIGDIDGKTDWTGALVGCSCVVHLAARVHVVNDKNINPLAAFRSVNVGATMNLARQAAEAAVKRLVFISSVKVNGESTTDVPFTSFDVPAPRDPYGVSKMEAEQALLALSKETGLEVVIVRPPLVYGPGVRANFFRLMQLVKMGVPLPLGAIHNHRSMVALDNLVDLLFVCSQHPNAPGQIFMASDERDVSISELLCMLAGAMGKRSLLLPVPVGIIAGAATILGKSAVARRLLGSLQVDIALTKSTLGWQPVVSLEESVNKTVAHFLKHQ